VKSYETGKDKIHSIEKLNNIIESGFKKEFEIQNLNKEGFGKKNMELESSMELESMDENTESNIENSINEKDFEDHNIIDLDSMFSNLQHLNMEEEKENEEEREKEEEEEEEENQEIEDKNDINNMTLIIETTSLDPLNTGFIETNEREDQTIETENDTPSIKFTLSIKSSRTVVLEKKRREGDKYVPILKFPQLSVCYHFDYHQFDLSTKKIKYSVLTGDSNKMEIPSKQIKLKEKKVKPPKLSIPQREKQAVDLVTRSRVLLMKSQLSLQNKPIPNSIQSIVSDFMKKTKKNEIPVHELEVVSSSKDEEIEI
jgi:hypothetical protein